MGIPPSSSLPIKTLHITNFYHGSSGGIRTFYRALLAAADRNRRHVRVVVPGNEDSIEDVGAFGRIYTLAAPRAPFVDSRYRLLLPHLYALPHESKLKKILRCEAPQLVEICDKYTLCFLPSLLRKSWWPGVTPPVMVGLSCERMDDNLHAYVVGGSLGRRFAGWYMKTVYGPRFDYHISNSDYTAGELSEALAQRPDLPIHVRPMGVDVRAFGRERRACDKRRSLAEKLGNTADAEIRLLLYVGRISAEKNIPLLFDTMDALARRGIANYRLIAVGSGPKAEWFAHEAAKRSRNQTQILLLGHIGDRERLADIYANCDAFLHPNPREPFGIAPLEAMASGLPVVAPNSGGLLSYANSANAWLVQPTGEAFADAVQDIFDDPAARRIKIERAARTAADFDWSCTTKLFFQLYDDLYLRCGR